MKEWQRDKTWSDLFVPEIVRVIAPSVIGVAPEEEDVRRNTDLVLRAAKGSRIACRVREYHFWNAQGGAYRDEFTIRSERDSGAETELSKIMRGWGDLFFYAISNEKDDGSGLRRWTLIDLNEFRLWFSRGNFEAARDRKKPAPGFEKRNHDGTRFLAFKVRDLPREAIVAHDGWLNVRAVSQRAVV